MIDWYMVASNAFWIVGASLALATLSYASWAAWSTHESFWLVLAKPAYQASISLAGVLFFLGLAASAQVIWQTVLWLALAVLCLWQVWSARRRKE
jgi:phosphatidylserine synthase